MTQSILFGESRSSDARLSACGRYRYCLLRRWASGPRAVFVMLNPSTADAHLNDPTIRRCMSFARSFGFGGLEVVNLFAWRATDPDAMFAAGRAGADIIGPQNDEAIIDTARSAALVIAAWGADVRATERAGRVLDMLAEVVDVHCLDRSKDGAPKHPLYLRSNLRPGLLRASSPRSAPGWVAR